MRGGFHVREDATTSRARGHSASPARLPPRPTRLIGREAEVAALQDLLLRDDIRLVTVTGCRDARWRSQD